jgi:hypothetical protein
MFERISEDSSSFKLPERNSILTKSFYAVDLSLTVSFLFMDHISAIQQYCVTDYE